MFTVFIQYFLIVARETISQISTIYKYIKNSQTLSSNILILFPIHASPGLYKKNERRRQWQLCWLTFTFIFVVSIIRKIARRQIVAQWRINWFSWYINWKIGPAIPGNLLKLGQLLINNSYTHTVHCSRKSSNLSRWKLASSANPQIPRL